MFPSMGQLGTSLISYTKLIGKRFSCWNLYATRVRKALSTSQIKCITTRKYSTLQAPPPFRTGFNI